MQGLASSLQSVSALQKPPQPGFLVKTHLLTLSSQLSSVHGSPSLQVRGLPAAQVPALQVSPTVHYWPSLQPLPHGRLLCWH